MSLWRCCSKIGYIRKQCIVVANDATVKAGAWLLPLRKIFAQEIAMENRLPIII
jgi:acetyl-CoA carboxylase carboxyltransferase component